ncbi:MAG: hypothetical protein OEW48_15130 [Phycisphaerae bacterium]|nr:hypothetical protein [Phycisphaerae bacterium]
MKDREDLLEILRKNCINDEPSESRLEIEDLIGVYGLDREY